MDPRRRAWPWGIAIASILIASLALLLVGRSIEIPHCEFGDYAARRDAIDTAGAFFFFGGLGGGAALLISIAALVACKGRRLFFIAPMALSAFLAYWGALATLGTVLACALY